MTNISIPANPLAPALQRGNIMLISLALLAAVTLLGTAAMQGAVQEERIAGNQIDIHIAREAAQSALAVGIANLGSARSEDAGYYDTTNGRSMPAGLDLYTWDTPPASTGSATILSSALWHIDATSSQNPQYKIERFAHTNYNRESGLREGDVGASGFSSYRVYGRGTGRDPNAPHQAIVEAVMIQQQ